MIYDPEQALRDIEDIVKNIYAKKDSFASMEAQVKKCFTVETNQEKFYEFINSVIRDEVEVCSKALRQFARK